MPAGAASPPTLELVLKRNSVERIKRDKSPLGMLDELPALIGAGYERVAEEDIVRLKWWGLYHDKPKIGTFMLRVKIPGGILSPTQLRAIGEISNLHGRGEGELTTRQNVQLHYISLPALPDVFERLVGAIRGGEEGFGLLVGGGLSSVPRIARELGIWVPKSDAVTVLAAILDEWREDLRYRVSRVKARLKFMIDDIGPEGMRERIEARLGRTFEDFTL